MQNQGLAGYGGNTTLGHEGGPPPDARVRELQAQVALLQRQLDDSRTSSRPSRQVIKFSLPHSLALSLIRYFKQERKEASSQSGSDDNADFAVPPRPGSTQDNIPPRHPAAQRRKFQGDHLTILAFKKRWSYNSEAPVS